MKKGKTLPEESSLRQKAEAIIEKLNSAKANPQGANIELSSTEAEMQKLIHELHVNQIELERQNAELRNAVEKAATAIALYDFAPTGYFTVKTDSTITQLNLSGAKMLGKGRLHLRNSRLNEFIAPDSQPAFNDFLQKCFETSLKQTCEIGLAVHGRHSFFLYLEGMVTEDNQECLVVAVDITERKRAEEALRASEQGVRLKLETILSPSGNPEVLELSDIIDAQAIQAIMDEFYSVTHIGVGLIDLNGKVLVANGWQDICTKFHRVHPEACRNCIESDTKLTLGGQLGSFNAYNCMNNMWDISTPIIVGGKHLGNIFLGQFLYDDEIPDYEVFRAQARKFGFDEEEYIDALDRVPRWSHETVKSVMSFYSRLSTLISNISYSNLKLAQTIEERNRAVEELKNNYSLLRIAGETAQFGGWSMDLSEKKIIWSDVVARIHEITPGCSPTFEEGINFYAPECRDQISRAASDCAEKGISYDLELELITAKGNRIWVRTGGEALRAENGEITKIQGSFQDITDRKRTEYALQKSRDLFSLFMNYSPVYTFIKEVTPEKSVVLKASDNFMDMVGISGKEMEGKTMEELFPVEFAAKVTADDWAVISGGKALTLEEELNGRSYTTIKFPILNGDKNLLAGYSIDVTDQKQRERELRESEARFRSTFDQSPVGSVMVGLDSRFIKCNAAFCDFVGYSEDELIGKTILDITYPEDRELGMKELKQLVEGKAEIARLQKRYVRKDGPVVWGELSICVVCDDDNKPIYFLPIIQDITERKQIEERLRQKEEKYRTLFENMTQGVFYQSADSIVTDVNEAALEMFGLSRDQILGRTSYDPDWKVITEKGELLAPEDHPSMKALISGKPSRDSIVGVYNPTNKQYRWLIVNAIPQFSPGETQQNRVFVTIHDITERKQIEAELAESEARFRNLLQAVHSVSVQGYAPDGTTQYWNKASELLYGYTAEEAIGRNLLDLIIPPEMRDVVKLAIQQMAETGQAIPSSELSLMRRDGSYVSVFSSHAIVKIPGRSQELFCIDVDLTERKRAEEELVELNRRLKELNANKDKFFSIIAHDLKSPFNSILGFSDLLERQIREKDYVAAEKSAGIIQNSSQQALDLLMNLLEWSRLQTGRMGFNPECIDIVDLINQSTELLNASALQKSITIYSEMPVNLPVFADKAMISTILRNLISNAIKFTDIGGKIVISTEQMSNELVVSVLDNGVGIKKESIGKLFRIDENYSTLGTQKEKGTGLGLLLCKEFVDIHGGRIWVESDRGKGSTFFFSIPKGIETNSSL